MNRLITIGQAAKFLGVSISTLRRWELDGKITPERTTGLHRRYDLAKIKSESIHAIHRVKKTIAYARVSSSD